MKSIHADEGESGGYAAAIIHCMNEEGDNDMVKFFVPEEAFTVRAIVVLCVVKPEVPVMVTVAAPVLGASSVTRNLRHLSAAAVLGEMP
jgi:hypothetical protein